MNRKWGHIIKPEGPPPQWCISSSIAPPPKGSVTFPTAPSSGGLVCKPISHWAISHLDHSNSYILPATRREEVHLLGWCTDTLFIVCIIATFLLSASSELYPWNLSWELQISFMAAWMRTVLCKLGCLNTSFPAGGAVWGAVCVALLEEVHPQGDLCEFIASPNSPLALSASGGWRCDCLASCSCQHACCVLPGILPKLSHI